MHRHMEGLQRSPQFFQAVGEQEGGGGIGLQEGAGDEHGDA